MKYRFRRPALYFLLKVLDTVFPLLPYSLALNIGRFFGWLAYVLIGKYRKLSKYHLRLAFGSSKSEDEISRIAKDTFMNLGMGMAEILSLPRIKNKLASIIDIEGLDKVDKVLKEGKGAVVLTGHFGNWELLPMYFAYKRYPSNIIARPLYYEKYNNWIMSLRTTMGVNVIYRTDYPRKLLEPLRNNELLGITPDQDIDSVDGVFVDFFGRKTYTPSAPVKIALAAGAPLIPIFMVRHNKRHHIIVEDPIRIENRRDKEAAALLYTQKYSDILESYIRRYPSQWVWMHRRWKTKPSC